METEKRGVVRGRCRAQVAFHQVLKDELEFAKRIDVFYALWLQLNFPLEIKHIPGKVGINLNVTELNIKSIGNAYSKIQEVPL